MGITREPSLNPKLEAVLARLCERLGVLTKTKAVKLPYLVDVVASQELGHRITEGTHQTWDYGVVTREVFSFISHNRRGQGPFVVEPHDYSEGGQQVRLRAQGQPDLLSREEQAIVDAVAIRYGRLDAESLGKLTKRINTHMEPEAWGSNHAAAVDEDAYARLADGWQAFCELLPDLDLTDESQWGDPIDDPREYLRRTLGV
ncbi:MAG TPA: type II toxin-antitoxin system antitoxin SocA domain-containing protein [Thermoanaerobaculia bacterium]